MITINEFIKRRDENTAEYLRQELSNSFDLKKYHGFDTEKGSLGKYILASKTHDILAAIALGFLPLLNSRSGTDAMRLNVDKFEKVELKTSYTDETKLIKTKRNAVYSATTDRIIGGIVPRDSTTSLKSNYEAAYNIVDNIGVKDIDTYLMLVDSRNDRFIDCFMIPGLIIGKYLSVRTIPSSGNIKIKFTIFEELGKQVTHTCVPVIGFNQWKDSLLPTLPVVHVQSPSRKKKKIKNISSPDLDCAA